MLRRLLVLGLSALAGAALAGSAGAAPTNSPNSFVIPATCDGQEVQFLVIGEGEFTPAHVVGSTSVFVPYSFDITFTFTPEGGTPMTEVESAAKAAPPMDAVTCEIDFSFTEPGEGTFTAVGTVTGAFTPRNG